MSYDFYLTSTFRHDWNRAFNPLIAAALESRGLRGYIPHRDTDQTQPPSARFEADLEGIRRSRIVLAVAENESVN